MSDPYRWLVWIHVCANVLWIGSIVAVAYFAATRIGEVGSRTALALRFYKSVATPAFIVSFISGGVVLASNLQLYFVVDKWMHGKLFFAFVVIVIHHIIGGRVRRASEGAHELTGPLKKIAGLLAAAAFATVFFAILRPM
jgi:protoporphyrinogen IX oxidase